ncbi:hypothetical protein [Lactobacillus iners]|uniref:hypothetical protein n=1 Tax=Lactobacillus iners TaxID=147802 RepID=UPI003EC0CA1D
MKVRYLGNTEGISLTKNKIYETLDYEEVFLRVIDDTGEDYLYDFEKFQVIEE